jgi:hypothetical protein
MQVKTFLKKVLVSIKNILLVDLVFSLLVAISFVFTRNFSFLAYSERLFWVGLGITVLAAVVAFSATFAGSKFGVPVFIRRPEEARKFREHIGDVRKEAVKREDVSIQLFFIGLGCIAISALVQIFLT